MRIRRLARSFAVTVVAAGVVATVDAAVGPSAATRAQQAPPPAPSQEAAKGAANGAASPNPVAADVETLRKLVAAGKWSEGAVFASSILERHEGDLRVLACLEEIETDLRICRYREQRKKPDATWVLGPGAKKANLELREAEFSFVALTPAERWSGTDYVRIFDVPFDDVSVTYAFDAFVRGSGGDQALPPPSVVLRYDSEREGGYALTPSIVTFDEGGVSMEGSIRRSGEKERGIAVGPGRSDDPIKRMMARLRVRAYQLMSIECAIRGSSITARVNGSELVSGADPVSPIRNGLVAFAGTPDSLARVSNVKLKGKVPADYLKRVQNEYDDRALRDWTASRWNREDALPKWILAAESEALFRRSMLPSDATDAARAWCRTWWDGLVSGDPAVRSALLEWLPASPLRTRTYLTAVLAVGAGRHAEADALLRNLAEHDPGFGPVWALSAVSAWSRRDRPATERALVRAREDAAYHPWTWEVAAAVALADGRFDAAQEAVDAAAVHAAGSAAIRDLRAVLMRLRRGPQWTKKFRAETKHYVVESDHGQSVCAEFGRMLEEARAAYRTQFRAADDGKKARVLVFSGVESYLEYTSASGSDAAGTLGVYRPQLRELCVFLHEDRRELTNTVRHEGFHQYLHQFADDVPVWFDEGYAEYFGFGRKVGQRHVAGQVGESQAILAMELQPEFIPLSELFVQSRREFMARPLVSYLQAWAAVHFLRSAKDPAIAGLLDRYLDALIAGKGREEAFEQVLKPVIGTLQEQFDAHVRALGTAPAPK